MRCFTSGFGWCFNVGEESSGLCFKTTQSSWEKLPYSWLKVGSCGVYIEDLETLLIWGLVLSAQWSQEFEILVWLERAEHETEKVDGVFERLWLPANVSSEES